MRVLGVIAAVAAFLVSAPTDGVAQSDLSGMWIFTVQSAQGEQPLPITIVQDGDDLKATGEVPEVGAMEMTELSTVPTLFSSGICTSKGWSWLSSLRVPSLMMARSPEPWTLEASTREPGAPSEWRADELGVSPPARRICFPLATDAAAGPNRLLRHCQRPARSACRRGSCGGF